MRCPENYYRDWMKKTWGQKVRGVLDGTIPACHLAFFNWSQGGRACHSAFTAALQRCQDDWTEDQISIFYLERYNARLMGARF